MSRIRLIVACLGVAALVLVAGCGKGEQKNLTKEQVAEQFVALMTDMTEAITSNKNDCDAMARALDGSMNRAAALKARSDELQKDPEVKKWFDGEGKKKFDEITPAVLDAIQIAARCRGQEGILKAMQVFQ